MEENELTDLKQLVKDNNTEDKIVVVDLEGIKTYPLKDFVGQPAEGILYDLDINECISYTTASTETLRWINQIATARVIKELKRQIDELNKK